MNIGGEKYSGLTFKGLMEHIINDVENKNIVGHDKVILCVTKEKTLSEDNTETYRWKGLLAYSSGDGE